MISINRLVCCLSIAIGLLDFADSASFVKQPQNNFTVRSGSSVWLQWTYTLSLIDSFSQYRCGMYDTVKKNMVVMVEKTGTKSLSVRAAWKNQVTVYPQNTTFAVRNLDLNNSGKYYCVLTFKNFVLTRVIQSHMIKLTVQGRPKFCQALPKTLEFNENQSINIPVAVCSSPQPILLFAAGPSFDFLPVRLTVDNLISYKFNSRIELSGMKRNACGSEVILKLSNELAAAKDEKIAITVRFKPNAPLGIEAKHLSDGQCIECTWGSQDSGSCAISYRVEFLDKDEGVIVSSTTKSRHASTCRAGIKKVRITAIFTGFSAASSITLEEATKAQGKQKLNDSSVAIGAGAGGGLLLLIVVIVVVFIIRRRLNRDATENKKQKVATKSTNVAVSFKPDSSGQGSPYVIDRPTENKRNEYNVDDDLYDYVKNVQKLH